MKELLRNNKGMTLTEVMIALAVLGLLITPIMMSFMNTQIYARKIDKQNEVNAITRTIMQNVSKSLKEDYAIEDINGNIIDVDEDTLPDDRFSSIIIKAKSESSKRVTVDDLPVYENGIPNSKFKYSITYDENYDNSEYFGVYNFLITVRDYNSGRIENELKIAVNLDKDIS
ncbi:MAG: hypothetical protein BWY74_01659 [Firmicutes bacterium ADurb.Bin419]|nr:MAG: hypothetical protein BWY74_01659 [Firmicutes bacterium ADurb.Bin419]